jgi:hypothetical protein
MKAEVARIGVMEVTYVTTSGTLLKALPQTFQADIMKANSKTPHVKAMNKVTLAAKYAPFGHPAPSSFEILVLLCGTRVNIVNHNTNKQS